MMTDKKQVRDYFTDDGFFICDGQKYGIAPDGRTYCAGPVVDTCHTTQDTAGEALEGGGKGKLPPAVVMQQKHPGGRPRKEGEVCRVTLWRREKAEQAVMAI